MPNLTVPALMRVLWDAQQPRMDTATGDAIYQQTSYYERAALRRMAEAVLAELRKAPAPREGG